MFHLIRIKHLRAKPRDFRGKGHISVHHKIDMTIGFFKHFLNV